MARINDGVLKEWLDGSVVKANEYKQEREILRVAINDNYDKLLERYTKTEVNNLLALLENDVESQINDSANVLVTHKDSSDHDERYYPRLDIDGLFTALKGAGYNNETLASLKVDFMDLQTQINNLGNLYSSDAERIAAINDVINQFQIADENLDTLINNKANKSDVYTQAETIQIVNGLQGQIDTNYSRTSGALNRITTLEGSESTRSTNETARQTAEITRNSKETERVTNEGNRAAAETNRQSQETIRQTQESARANAEINRQSTEATRVAAEVARENQEAQRQSNAVLQESRISSAVASANSATNSALKATIDANTAINTITTNAAEAKAAATTANEAAETARTYWLEPVANFAAIATTYPNSVNGSQVVTIDTQMQYRKINGSWTWTGVYSANGVTDLQLRLQDQNRQQVNLTHGQSIFAAALNSPVEFEIQGRTLTSLGMSNLEGNKNYVLSGKNYKIRVEGKEGTLINGVGKFTKSASLTSKADFVGKTTGDLTTNPHKAFRGVGIGTVAPNVFSTEFDQTRYNNITSLNGSGLATQTTSGNGEVSQMLFSMSVIEHIERKHGRIPADTTAGKVQWIKDNVQRLTANWHGWGSSVGGNGAFLKMWYQTGNAWTGTTKTHSSGSVAKLDFVITTILDYVDTNGFVHALAYANASDGSVPSTLNTDFIELELELKATAVLDTRPIITRVATFEGKINGDLVSNPHIAKRTTSAITSPTLLAPNAFTYELSSVTEYNGINSLNGTPQSATTTVNGAISQMLFSYNIIAEIENNIGRIPKATLAEKVQWCKDNVDKLTGEWSGFGLSVGGSKASVTMWVATGNLWATTLNHTSSAVSKITYTPGTTANYIGSDGFVHFLAYAEPSDGVTASTINTDYINLDISLKQGATLHDPMTPLYEVDATEFANILVAWDETNVLLRYPMGMSRHLQNIAIIAEGENLLPPFYEWTLDSTHVVRSPYAIDSTSTSTALRSSWEIPYVKGATYSINFESVSGDFLIRKDSPSGSVVANATTKTFTAPTDGSKLYAVIQPNASGLNIKNPMLTLGNVAKPFVPRNPSYLFIQTKLGQIADKKDSLFRSDGVYYHRKLVEVDKVLDGSLAWNYGGDGTGVKTFTLSTTVLPTLNRNTHTIQKYNGVMLRTSTSDSTVTSLADGSYINSTPVMIISVSDLDTGFGETYNPIADEIKAYFHGWQAKTVDANGKPTAWKSLGDGTDAPTQTLAYVSANKAPNFTPYKLSYVRAIPETIKLDKGEIEGDIVVSGQTQIQVTSGFNVTYDANGKRVFTMLLERDRYKSTCNATEVRAFYAGNLKEVVDMNVEKLSDLATQTSINTNLIYRLLVQAKANNWVV